MAMITATYPDSRNFGWTGGVSQAPPAEAPKLTDILLRGLDRTIDAAIVTKFQPRETTTATTDAWGNVYTSGRTNGAAVGGLAGGAGGLLLIGAAVVVLVLLLK